MTDTNKFLDFLVKHGHLVATEADKRTIIRHYEETKPVCGNCEHHIKKGHEEPCYSCLMCNSNFTPKQTEFESILPL